MKEMRNILGWLGMQEERVILEDARKHVEETFQTVSSFAEAVRALVTGDLQGKMAAISRVQESERRADALKAHMIDNLSKDFLMPPDRDDLIHFAKTLDRIADRTNSAAKLLGFIEDRPPEPVLKNIATATEIIFVAVSHLRRAIEATIANDARAALEHCTNVARSEHDADDQKKTLIEAIIHADMKPATLLLSYQLAEDLEGITDKINDASDFIRSIAIKSK